MTYRVGQRVRFLALFRGEDEQPFDPAIVDASIEAGGGIRRCAPRRLGPGQYAIDVTIEAAGSMLVRFDSKAPDQRAFIEQRYAVEEGARSDEAASIAVPPSVVMPASPEPPSPSYERGRRLALLRAHGVAIDEARSDAYLEAAYDEAVRRGVIKKEISANEVRSREIWREPLPNQRR